MLWSPSTKNGRMATTADTKADKNESLR
jgi:hypothetical protein